MNKHILNELELFFTFLEAKKFVQNYIFFPRSHFSSLCSNWCKKLYIMCIQFFHFRKLIFFSFTFSSWWWMVELEHLVGLPSKMWQRVPKEDAAMWQPNSHKWWRALCRTSHPKEALFQRLPRYIYLVLIFYNSLTTLFITWKITLRWNANLLGKKG